LEYGPPNPDDPEKPTSDGETVLSEPECGECVQFIFSHMVNRFKGELAELLAIQPVLELIEQLRVASKWSDTVHLYLGETIQERRQIKRNGKLQWGEFVKGADGLIVEVSNTQPRRVKVCGVVEVKSMYQPEKKLTNQIKNHLHRMAGGLRLNGQTWDKSQILCISPLHIMVIPSGWKLDRECYYRDGQLIYPNEDKPSFFTRLEKKGQNRWMIVLDWSTEALEQAAYEMTYWYMSQVGTAIYDSGSKPLPKGWEDMSPEEAGYNAIKMMLYYIMLRSKFISSKHDRLATKLYNAYSFGYPKAMETKEMLWPEDIPHLGSNDMAAI
jgi:hypothetical protein